MSILLFLLMAPQMQTEAVVQQDIVVIGQRLKRWTARYKVRGSRTTCTTKQSSGDRAIDAIGCSAFETCVDQLQPRIQASDAKDIDKAPRLAMKESIKRDLTRCVTARRDVLIAELADRRAQARQGVGSNGER